MSAKFEEKKIQAKNWRKKKKELWQLICGNGIAEIEGKKNVAIDL